jgi:hypothetical protein
VQIADVKIDDSQLAVLCAEFGGARLEIFGSAARGEAGPGSDADFIVRFKDNDLGPWMSGLTHFEAALSELIGRPADAALEEHLGWVLQLHIHNDRQTLYAATALHDRFPQTHQAWVERGKKA